MIQRQEMTKEKKLLAKTKVNLQYIVIIIKLFTYDFKYIFLEGLGWRSELVHLQKLLRMCIQAR